MFLVTRKRLRPPPSLAYSLRIFVKRNKLLVGAVAAVFAALVFGIFGTSWQAHVAGVPRFQNEIYLVAYLLLTSFFLLYVPFSKISHYLYYPFTRYWIGRALGHRGSLPFTRA